MNKWDVGDVVRVTMGFSQAGAAVDPDNVSVRVRAPSGAQDYVTVTRVSAGNYRADIEVTEPGIWWYRVLGEGGAAAAAEQSFLARTRRVTG